MPVTIQLPAELADRLARLRSSRRPGAPADTRGTEASARRLSERYRADRPAASPIIADAGDASAYALTRLPATFAAARFAFEELARAVPGLAPRTLLDVGAGTGAATAAAWATWDSLDAATLEDYSAPALAVAREVLAATDLDVTTTLASIGPRRAVRADPGAGAAVRADDTDDAAGPDRRADLAVAGYVLSEIDDAARRALVDRLTAGAREAVVVIEPGTPAGFRRVLEVRAELLRRGWRVAAPCPHGEACPVAAREGDWCHAAVRLPRTREHRAAKGGERGFEDEKFSWVAALAPTSGPAIARPAGRVLRHPETRPGHIRLELCAPDGGIEQVTVTKRDRDAFRAARKIEWGEAWEL